MTDALPDSPTLRRFLSDGRNPDGGWGYSAGKASRLEPTCWGLLALRDADPSALTSWPVMDGLLRERRDGDANFAFHALALLVLAARRVEHAAGNRALALALEQARGIALEPSRVNRQDNRLQGWSWMAGTFSWVEPTAWALLALRKRQASGQPVDTGRLTQATALLADRCCQDGGWNYGNANMLGTELRPYVPTTAIALLALQKSALPAVSRSLAFLEAAAVTESSATALSLATLSLAAHGRAAETTRSLLAAQAGRTMDLGQLVGAAMALHTLQANATDAFTL